MNHIIAILTILLLVSFIFNISFRRENKDILKRYRCAKETLSDINIRLYNVYYKKKYNHKLLPAPTLKGLLNQLDEMLFKPGAVISNKDIALLLLNDIKSMVINSIKLPDGEKEKMVSKIHECINKIKQ